MARFHPFLATGSLILVITTLSSCSPGPTSVNNSNSPVVSSSVSPSVSPSVTVQPSPGAVQPKAVPQTAQSATGKTIAVTIYTPDRQCLDLLPQKISVSATQPLQATVGKIITNYNSSDFRVSQYQVKLEGGTAIVDLQVAPDSQRTFNSLTTCEQLALFGSIQKTLTSNAHWQIEAVEFTQDGKELLF